MMGLISGSFVIFVVVTAIIYYLSPKKYQWVVLLFASYTYYLLICNKYIVYMLITTLTTWAGALGIGRLFAVQKETVKAHKAEWSREEKKAYKEGITKKCCTLLVLVLLLNFGILGVLKYTSFALELMESLGKCFGLSMHLPDPGFLLPLGISFYTFQSMGYLIDVYQEKVEPERNLLRFALFVSFFPQIIQGPIAIYEDLAHQLYEPHDFSFYCLKDGFALILWGVFKKMVIADRAVKLIKYVTETPADFPGTFILMAALFYAVQLYADFSGGIDIVRGIAEIFGITMAENFKRPYFSLSLTEYWHRWHMTLGNWVRTYVFYPLSISKSFLRMGKKISARFGRHMGRVVPVSLASLITFLIIGIWHGASGKYVAFGLWNGLVIMLMEILRPYYDRILNNLKIKKEHALYKLLCMATTFLLVLVGYYFDIAKNFSDAMYMLGKSVTDFHLTDLPGRALLSPCGLHRADYLIILMGTVILLIVSLVQERSGRSIREMLWQKNAFIQGIILEAAILGILIFGYYGPGLDSAAFIYMQF